MDCGTHYEYLATWVDDVLHWSKNPMKLIKQLEERFSLKGTGVPEYYLGGDIEQVKWDDAPRGRPYHDLVCSNIHHASLRQDRKDV